MTKPTTEQINAYMAIVEALSEAIEGLGEVPSGHLYAVVMGKINLDTYERIIDLLVSVGCVTRKPGHVLKWTGGEK